MDLRKLKTLIDLISESNIQELEISEGEDKVRIVKSSSSLSHHIMMQPQAALPPVPMSVTTVSPTMAQDEEEKVYIVKAPMVGTFYNASSPGADPYCQIGNTVNKGDTLCIIEAMKLMNEIKAEQTGKIREIHVKNGGVVEYGCPLFTLIPE